VRSTLGDEAMITLSFECTSAEDAKTYIDAPDAKWAAQEFREQLRSKIKHGDHSPEVLAELLAVQEWFYEAMEGYI
jgi:hypothetical protein